MSPEFPSMFLWSLTLVASAGMFYYGAILSGLYKDPLMAQFRTYGEEHRPFLINRFLEIIGGWCILMAIVVRIIIAGSALARSSFAPLTFLVIAVMAFTADIIVRRRPAIREAFPRWYYDLLHVATRQERRFIGWAWLRIPRKMRWRLNGDQAAFRVWSDMVRITVVYGARERDDPWSMWS